MVTEHRSIHVITENDIRNALRSAHIPDDEYSINEYCECTPCIERTPNGWLIYDGERGLKHNPEVFHSMSDIVNSLKRRLGYPASTIKISTTSYRPIKPSIRTVGLQRQLKLKSRSSFSAQRRSHKAALKKSKKY